MTARLTNARQRRREGRRVMLAAMVVLALSVWGFGCSTTARHPDAARLGPRAAEISYDEALDNLDHMMGMPMSEARAYRVEQNREAHAEGERLFSDPRLGRNGRSCNSCHVDGGTIGGETEIPRQMGHGPYKLPIPSLLGAAARYPRFSVTSDRIITLEMMNNVCIRQFMAGKRLPLDTPEAFYLTLYVKSLSNGDSVDVGR